jgi:formyl-CoA transferase
MTAIGRDDLGNDPDLKHNDGRVQRAEELDAAIGQWTKTRSRDEALSILDAADVPAGKIYSIADIMADPQYLARDMIVEAECSDGSKLRVPGIVPKLSATPGRIRRAAPRLGQDGADLERSGGWPVSRIDE